MERNLILFEGDRLLAEGPEETVHPLWLARSAAPAGRLVVFEADTGRVVDLDPRAPVRGRGRPKLGVTAREVTLLPRHWDWLATQPGGASATLRRLVEAARREDAAAARAGRDAAYRVLTELAGDRPGYEEAMRALFRGDRAGFEAAAAGWPEDPLSVARRLGFGG